MSFYHVGFAVPDLAAAMRELRAAAGIGWAEPRSGRIGEWEYRIVFSRPGPPFVELIEAVGPGGPWDASDGPRFHHLGFWSEDAEAGSRRLSEGGFPVEFSGCPFGRPYVYHHLKGLGAHVELVDAALQAGFLATWQPGGPPMPALPEPVREPVLEPVQTQAPVREPVREAPHAPQAPQAPRAPRAARKQEDP
ncbi:VOC family protein [Streptomyces sp. NPDC048623]|uniref:VOC family protein n=1 Tax=Streptomyces sp. NPDC048623 TaxID=3155761 RepID=UPI0034497CB6